MRTRLMGVAVFAIAGTLFAMNGTAVYIHWWEPNAVEWVWGGSFQGRGRLISARIENNQVVQRDTIYKSSLAQYPALDFSGTRVAFFRWGQQVEMDSDGKYHAVAGTENNPNYISVINTDGTGLTNLIEVSAPCISSGGDNAEGNALLDWTCGQWIYYEKPSKSEEIRRINVDDPSRDEYVCNYGTNLRRWDLSWDAQYSGWQSRGSTVFNGGSTFPGLSSRQFCVACNAAVSCGGNFIAHYYGGQHSDMFCSKWKPSFQEGYDINWISDIEGWLGEDITMPGSGGADLIRWSVNSEKWVMRQIGWCGQASQLGYGSNCIAVNWKDDQAINVSKTPPPPECNWVYLWWERDPPHEEVHSTSGDAGDLWVDHGAGNHFKWEDEDGQLHTEDPIDPVGIVGIPGPTALRVSASRPVVTAGADGLKIDCGGRQNISVAVTDLQGHTAYRRTVGGVMNLGGDVLPAGMYVVSMRDGQRVWSVPVVVR